MARHISLCVSGSSTRPHQKLGVSSIQQTCQQHYTSTLLRVTTFTMQETAQAWSGSFENMDTDSKARQRTATATTTPVTLPRGVVSPSTCPAARCQLALVLTACAIEVRRGGHLSNLYPSPCSMTTLRFLLKRRNKCLARCWELRSLTLTPFERHSSFQLRSRAHQLPRSRPATSGRRFSARTEGHLQLRRAVSSRRQTEALRRIQSFSRMKSLHRLLRGLLLASPGRSRVMWQLCSRSTTSAP